MNNQSRGGKCHTLWYFQILLLIIAAVFASLNVRAYDDAETLRIALPQSYQYDLNLISIGSANVLPTEGKFLVIVAKIDDSYYQFRIFDGNGKKVIDKGKDEFSPEQTLIQQLEEAFSKQPIDHQTKRKLLQNITSSLGYTPSTCLKFKDSNCAKLTVGNDYQVLEWLLNGKVDGAVLSPLMLDLLRSNYRKKKNGNEFSHHFRVLDEGNFNGLALQTHRYRLQANFANQFLQTKEAFEYFLNELTSSSSHKRLYLPSHLSPALPQLFKYVAKWLDNHSQGKNKDFWERFLNQIGFYIYNDKIKSLKNDNAEIFIITAAEKCSDNMQSLCLGESASKDTLVLHQHAISNIATLHQPEINSGSIHHSCTEILFDLNAPTTDSAPPDIRSTFCKNNYSREDAGTRRHYRFLFTIDEIWKILHHSTDPHNKDDKSKDDKSLALILTGGGVKAAYQTGLLEKFYKEDYLTNSIKQLPAYEKRDDTLLVKHVIGTSGGALLGMFVASIDKEEKNQTLELSNKLWHKIDKQDEYIDANNIFPWMDLMRWLSLVVCIIVFALVLTIYGPGPAQNLWQKVVHLWQKFVRRGTAQQKKAIPWGWRFITVWWIVLLGGSPLLIKLTHGNILEHIPAIEGFVYFLCSLIAIYSYNRVNFTQNRRETKSKSRVTMLLLLAVGIILTVIAIIITKHIKGDWSLSLLTKYIKEDWFVSPLPLLGWDFHITPTTLMACIGILLIFFATHLLFKRIYGYSQSRFIGSFAIITMVCLLTYILYAPIVWVGYGTLLEMTPLFWYWLIFLSIVVSFAVVYLAYGKYAPKTWQKWLQPYMDYLRSSDPSWRYWPLTRYGRIVLLFTLAWVWWNFIVAPGLYGNEQARSYLYTAYNRAMTGESDTLKLQTFFTVPVTALEKEKEYYVLFSPKQSDEKKFHSLLYSHNLLTLRNNPRWITIYNQETQEEPNKLKNQEEPNKNPEEPPKEPLNKLFLDVVFASGSPFPIFPATRVNLPIGEEWLVDGGYAHNIPIQAASQLGARRLLIISSSPRKLKQSKEEYFQVYGNLFHNLRRLIPYFYERSQIEDILSAEDMLVARLAPSANTDDWPFLMDFRKEIVKQMFDEATTDFEQRKRIGDIESWGKPVFLTDDSGQHQK